MLAYDGKAASTDSLEAAPPHAEVVRPTSLRSTLAGDFFSPRRRRGSDTSSSGTGLGAGLPSPRKMVGRRGLEPKCGAELPMFSSEDASSSSHPTERLTTARSRERSDSSDHLGFEQSETGVAVAAHLGQDGADAQNEPRVQQDLKRAKAMAP